MGDMPTMPIATASVSWTDANGGVHLRVYSTDGYKVEERCYDGSWTTSNFAAVGSQVSATCWVVNGSASIRVYCTFQNDTVEWCSDNGGAWYQGAFSTT
jgi:hypothetical protein